jgi:hypothetical protein
MLVFVAVLNLVSLACERQPQDAQEQGTGEQQQDAAETTVEDVTREVREAGEAAAAFSKERAEELRKDLEDRLAEFDVRIATLRERGDELSEEARREWQAQMERVAEKRDALESELQALQGASADAWQEIERGVNAAWGELEEAYESAAAEFEGAEGKSE